MSQKNQKDLKNFNHVWREAIVVDYCQLQVHVGRLQRNVREVRRYIYRFTQGVLLMRENYHNELLDMIASEGKTVQQWMDQHFELIEAIGDTRERLFATIKAGTTESEYVQDGEIAIARKHIKTSSLPAAAQDTVESAAPDSPEERAKHFEDVAEALKTQLRAARKDNRTLRDDLARTIRRVDQLERALKRADKTLDGALQAV